MSLLNNLFDCGEDLSQQKLHVIVKGKINSYDLWSVAKMALVVSQRLKELGIQPNDRVGISARNSLEALVLDLAVISIRGVTAGIEAGAQRIDPLEAITRFDLNLFFIENADYSDQSRLLPISVVTEWINQWEKSGSPTPIVPEENNYSDNDIVAIKFTSGSTGPPKGLEARVGSLDASLGAVQKMFNHSSDDNVLIFLPQNLLQQRYWVYSAFHYRHDVSIVHVDSVSDASTVCRTARDTHATVIMGVPVFYDTLMKQVIATSQNEMSLNERELLRELLGSNIRYMWTGSAPISRETVQFFTDAGFPLYEGYGLNETCIVAKNYPGAMKIGTAGKVLDHKSIRFDDDGVIIIGSPQPVNTHYTWCRPGDNEKVFKTNGEVYTNDIGYLDEDGYLYIVGRKDDILVLTSGFNILPAPIEDQLSRHEAIRRVVLVGHERPFLTAIVDYKKENISEDDIRCHFRKVAKTLLPEQTPGAVIFSEEPMTLTNGMLGNQGKPVRKIILEKHKAALDKIYVNQQHTNL